MAIKARYTHPIQVVESKPMRDVIKEISDRENVSQAAVIRDLIDGTRPPLNRAAIEADGGVGGV